MIFQFYKTLLNCLFQQLRNTPHIFINITINLYYYLQEYYQYFSEIDFP